MSEWSEAAERLVQMVRDGKTMDEVEAAAATELDRLTTEDREDFRTMTTTETTYDRQYFSPRVDNGIELLDERVPDWRVLIDTDRLNMRDASSCVLAQVYSISYPMAAYRLSGLQYFKHWSVAHGFTVPQYDLDAWIWEELQAVWLDRLAQPA